MRRRFMSVDYARKSGAAAMGTATVVAVAALLLGACGTVEIAPEPAIPDAIITPMPVKVGVVLTGDQRNYAHNETRAGVGWDVQLGEGHGKLARRLFGAMFTETEFYPDLDGPRGANGLAAIFEPRMEQYSFATARETGGNYYAVTIRYRVNVYAPDMKLADSYTITGYGNNRDQAMSSAKPLEGATRAAMRDAAAKFLVQFPEQPIGQQLARGEKVEAPAGTAVATAADEDTSGDELIEALPIVDGSGTASSAPPVAPAPPEPQPEPQPQPQPPSVSTGEGPLQESKQAP